MMRSALYLILPLFLTSCGYNSLQGLDENVKAAWAEVENQYQRRSDLVPNLVETVKGFAKQERETLEAVIKARAEATQVKLDAKSLSDPQAVERFEKMQGQFGSALSRLMMVSEQYPQLRSNENFRDLQAQLEGTENRITVARKRYIETVAEFNKGVRFFPTNLTAKFLLGLEPRATFQATTPNASQTPAVKF
jgi:LemA protein